ncbi:hypothetical protein D8S78_15945 [Natrialba swarupiae]|nr:hypothetical protein [Natrialba swarupiae]
MRRDIDEPRDFEQRDLALERRTLESAIESLAPAGMAMSDGDSHSRATRDVRPACRRVRSVGRASRSSPCATRSRVAIPCGCRVSPAVLGRPVAFETRLGGRRRDGPR